MNCTPYFAGLADCQSLLKKVKGVMVTEKGTTYTFATFVTESVLHLGIADATTANRNASVFPFLNYERTTDDPSIQTSNLGIKDKDLDPPPSMQGWLDASFCDYKTLHSLEGLALDIVLFTTDGKQIGTVKSDGSVKGFRAKISTRKDLPPSDNAQASYPVDILFRNASEFENAVVFEPDYSFDDVLDFVPAGLNVRITTAYSVSTGKVTVKVTERCTDTGKTGLAAADFEVLASDGDAPVSVTVATDNGLGEYELTINEDVGGTPSALDSGDFYKLQVSDDDSTYVTFLSNVIKEVV